MEARMKQGIEDEEMESVMNARGTKGCLNKTNALTGIKPNLSGKYLHGFNLIFDFLS
jgi:hypothetical protein